MNDSFNEFLMEQEKMLKLTLQACKECQKKMAECAQSVANLPKTNYHISNEQKIRMDILCQNYRDSIKQFEESMSNLLSAFDTFKKNLI